MGRADAVHAGLPLGGRGERGLVGKLPGLSGLRGGHLAEVWSQELGRRKAGEMLTRGQDQEGAVVGHTQWGEWRDAGQREALKRRPTLWP